MNNDEIREALAAYAHEAWSGWMQYLFGKCAEEGGTLIIPVWAVARWTRQMSTAYADLPESEKASDRAEADKMLAILGSPCWPMMAAHSGAWVCPACGRGNSAIVVTCACYMERAATVTTGRTGGKE